MLHVYIHVHCFNVCGLHDVPKSSHCQLVKSQPEGMMSPSDTKYIFLFFLLSSQRK